MKIKKKKKKFENKSIERRDLIFHENNIQRYLRDKNYISALSLWQQANQNISTNNRLNNNISNISKKKKSTTNDLSLIELRQREKMILEHLKQQQQNDLKPENDVNNFDITIIKDNKPALNRHWSSAHINDIKDININGLDQFITKF